MLCIGIIDQQPVALDRGPAVSYSIGEDNVTAEISILVSNTALTSLSFAGPVMRSCPHCVRDSTHVCLSPRRAGEAPVEGKGAETRTR